MARGWESKDVESRIQDAIGRKPLAGPRSPVDADQRTREARRQALLLQRIRLEGELRSAADPRFRALVERELAWVDAQLALFD